MEVSSTLVVQGPNTGKGPFGMPNGTSDESTAVGVGALLFVTVHVYVILPIPVMCLAEKM